MMIPNNLKRGSDLDHETPSQTWSALLTRSIPLIYGIYLRRGIHPGLAEELTQKTVFDAVRGRTAYDPLKGTLEQWVIGIAYKNLALEMRHRAVRARAVENLSACLRVMETALLPDELLEKKETGELVRRAMAALPAKERNVLELKYLQDLTAREIAGRMKSTEKAVHSLLYRARIQLRDQLKTMEPLFKEVPDS
ncbi:MAG: sigma-70 family RNA polymerase sigma factor [Planctomycetes bacterium]|nr:sigma-70 family RNA polymerase sigma factor [Planctomycetota bacterium]